MGIHPALPKRTASHIATSSEIGTPRKAGSKIASMIARKIHGDNLEEEHALAFALIIKQPWTVSITAEACQKKSCRHVDAHASQDFPLPLHSTWMIAWMNAHIIQKDQRETIARPFATFSAATPRLASCHLGSAEACQLPLGRLETLQIHCPPNCIHE